MPFNALQKREIFETVRGEFARLLHVDPVATSALLQMSVPCKDEVETQTAMVPKAGPNGLRLSPLGLLNGFLDHVTGRRLAAVVNDDSGRIEDFVEYDPSNYS